MLKDMIHPFWDSDWRQVALKRYSDSCWETFRPWWLSSSSFLSAVYSVGVEGTWLVSNCATEVFNCGPCLKNCWMGWQRLECFNKAFLFIICWWRYFGLFCRILSFTHDFSFMLRLCRVNNSKLRQHQNTQVVCHAHCYVHTGTYTYIFREYLIPSTQIGSGKRYIHFKLLTQPWITLQPHESILLPACYKEHAKIRNGICYI